jgi:large subunit ribosomal protein L25
MASKATFELTALVRTTQGKGASRRLRQLEDRVPAVIYGGQEIPECITLDHKKVMHALEHEAFYSHILTLNFKETKQQVVLKAVQRHPYKRAVLHMDFQRAKPTDSIHMRVPLHFVGAANAPGIKQGGIFTHQMNDLEIRCEAQYLPEFIVVDISSMQLEQILHLSDIVLPTGIEIVALSHGTEHDHPVVSLHLPRGAKEDTTATDTPAPAAVPATAIKNTEAPKTAPAAKGKSK